MTIQDAVQKLLDGEGVAMRCDLMEKYGLYITLPDCLVKDLGSLMVWHDGKSYLAPISAHNLFAEWEVLKELP